ncbi:MAG: ABC transporter, substrate-binding protein (cluster 3, basic aa/glutamine/opines) [uncultured Paraburkholderia sp.]|nr:MAG: ABC transporter, substrate-binding protein (cluster 3, basic aa/glutamine/opines) [uncultured Paraburkholderia sp.]CAH2919954.1 MAG: ABC transporter, substrate-binding protein (cluster 3, basic aa/glutamine/opines) [uncultured Paraburkholderia sp.]
MKKLLAALTVALLATVSIGAHAKDWSTIRFGVDASYPRSSPRVRMASSLASISTSAMKSARA